MVKQPACAAAMSVSGLVPFSFSKRVLKEYGVSARTPESVERLPLPARPVPRQTAFALRIMEASVLHVIYCSVPHVWAPPRSGRRQPSRPCLDVTSVDVTRVDAASLASTGRLLVHFIHQGLGDFLIGH